MSATWEEVNQRLVGAILSLDLADVLTIGDRGKPAKRGFLGRQQAPAPRRFVRIAATRTDLFAECVGSTSFGGDWPMTGEQEATLERQGWEKPWSEEYHTYQRKTSLLGAPRLALATVRALQLLGTEVTELQFERSREERA